jgi:hypothetical protein
MPAHRKPRFKGSTLRPASKAIVAYLQANGRQSFEQLEELFKEPSQYRSEGPTGHKPNPMWLRTRLNLLRDADHVTKTLEQGTWYFEAAYPTGTEQTPRARLPLDCQSLDVVPPRRIYVMGGGNYVPPAPSPRRDGSMDFAECPSVEAGSTRPFVPGKAIYG